MPHRLPALLIPKRIEVEPVVGCKMRIMFEALGVTLHPELNIFRATIAIQIDLVGKMFEVNFVAIAAPVESKKQNHRTTHHGSKQDWAGWERSRRVQELTPRCLFGAKDAVAQHA